MTGTEIMHMSRWLCPKSWNPLKPSFFGLGPLFLTGSLAAESHLPNPLDTLLVVSSRVFPLDYMVLCAVILAVFAASLLAVTRIGVWFLWLRLYKLRRYASVAEGSVWPNGMKNAPKGSKTCFT